MDDQAEEDDTLEERYATQLREEIIEERGDQNKVSSWWSTAFHPHTGGQELERIHTNLNKLKDRMNLLDTATGDNPVEDELERREDRLAEQNPLRSAWYGVVQNSIVSLEAVCKSVITTHNCSRSIEELSFVHNILLPAVALNEVPPSSDYNGQRQCCISPLQIYNLAGLMCHIY